MLIIDRVIFLQLKIIKNMINFVRRFVLDENTFKWSSNKNRFINSGISSFNELEDFSKENR